MSSDNHTAIPKKELAELPDEVTSNIVRHMDNLTTVCFALTSRKSYDIVKSVKRGPLRGLCPAFRGDMHVKVNGTSEHELFIRRLWKWLGRRCAYCGVAENNVKEYKEGNWKYARHVCREWLRLLELRTRHNPQWNEVDKFQVRLEKSRFDIAMTGFECEIKMMEMKSTIIGLRDLGASKGPGRRPQESRSR